MVANFEAVFRALERAQKKGVSRDQGVFLFPLHAHYSWKKSLKLFGIPEKCVAWLELDDRGRVDLRSYEAELRRLSSLGSRPVLCVGVVGSTEIGAMDPIEGMKSLLEDIFPEAKCWFHVDAAYGGFYATLKSPPSPVRNMFIADSLTLDPHKLGYVPYAAGAFLCQNSQDYYSVSTDAPYVQYEKNIDPGPFTLEGSRSATGAAAVWMVEKTLGLGPEGLGRIIERTMDVRTEMLMEIQLTGGVVVALGASDSNIVCIVCPKKGEFVSETNRRTLGVYQRLNESVKPAFTVSKTSIDRFRYDRLLEKTLGKWGGKWDTDDRSAGLVVLRLCLMNPFTGSKEMRPRFTHELVRLICTESANFA
jgi:glutamate/tyrosine decarboxylase-like PLP-dependent enzyme